MHVLILPGWHESVASWEPVQTALEALGYEVSIFGYETPKNDDVEDQVELTLQHITQKTLLVGASVGGRIAIQVLHQKPHHVIGGLLFSTPSLKYVGWKNYGNKCISFIFLLPRLLTPGIVKRNLLKLWEKIRRTDPDKAHYKRVTGSEQESLLPLITTPVKLVWPAKDKVVSPSIGRAMAEVMPKADFVTVAGVTEQFYLKNPTLAANIIDGFIIELEK